MTIQDLTFVLGLLLKICTVYFVLVAVFVLKKEKKLPEADRYHKIAVLVPARNEEAVIGNLVDCLRAQAYPPEFYDVYIIPNNCRDDTAGAARRAGARILTCDKPVRCKGDVLKEAFSKLLAAPEGYEAFCVFDADNAVDPGYLREMNKALCAGAKAAKGKIEARNPYDSWVAGCYSIYFDAMNLFFNRPRGACGLSAKLVGTGFVVHRALLERMGGWQTDSITEDVEFGARCAELGERVWWVPSARSYDEEPNRFSVSMTQRRRWCGGIIQVAFLRLPALFRSLGRGGGRRAFDYLMFLLMPFGKVLSLLPLCVTATLFLLESEAAAVGVLSYLLLSYLGGCLAALAVLLFSRKGDKRMLKAVLMFPVFTASWLPLHLLGFLRRPQGWKEIRHGQMKERGKPLKTPAALDQN